MDAVDGSEEEGEDEEGRGAGVTALLHPNPKNAMARAASGFMRLIIAPSWLGLHASKAPPFSRDGIRRAVGEIAAGPRRQG